MLLGPVRSSPRVAGQSSGPHMDHVPGETTVRVVSAHRHHQVALGGQIGGQCPRSRRRPARPGPGSRAWCSGTGSRRPAGPARAPCRDRPPAARGRRAGRRAARPVDGSPGQLAQRRRPIRPARGEVAVGRGPVHVDPDPHHDRGRRGSRRRPPAAVGGRPRSASASTPASLRPSGPSRSFGHLIPTRSPVTASTASAAASATAAVARWRSPTGRSGRSSTDSSRLDAGRGLPAPTEPPPAGRLVVGHRHHPVGCAATGPRRAGTGWSSRSSRSAGCR